MTDYTFASLPDWVKRNERAMDAVARQALNDTLGSIKIVAGRKRGGSPQRGEIPRDTGRLANSLVSTIHGGTSATGEASHVAAIADMSGGDEASFSWTTDYARAVHDGTAGRAGLHWIDVAAQKWQGFVSAAAARLAR